MKEIVQKLPLVLLVCVTISSCSTVVLYPIEKQDIVDMKKGTVYTSDRDGWFVSDFYIKEVMNAKVKR